MHLDGGLGGLGTLVAQRATGTVEGILLIVHGEDSENHRDVAIGVEGGDTLGDALAYIVEVGRSATDNAAEDDYSIIQR